MGEGAGRHPQRGAARVHQSRNELRSKGTQEDTGASLEETHIPPPPGQIREDLNIKINPIITC